MVNYKSLLVSYLSTFALTFSIPDLLKAQDTPASFSTYTGKTIPNVESSKNSRETTVKNESNRPSQSSKNYDPLNPHPEEDKRYFSKIDDVPVVFDLSSSEKASEETYSEQDQITSQEFFMNSSYEGIHNEGFRFRTCRLEFGAEFGEFIGLNKGYGEIGIFATGSLNRDTGFFLDTRWFLFSSNEWAASIGLGVRKILDDCCSAIGANVYYDFCRAELDEDVNVGSNGDIFTHTIITDFNRLGLGLEFFTSYLDSRANVYIPVGSNIKSSRMVNFAYPDTGDSAGYQMRNVLRYGADIEFGKKICLNPFASLYAGVGGYYFDHRNLDSVSGPFARLELFCWDFIRLQFLYSYDSTFESQCQGRILFSLPLEKLFNFGDCCCQDSCLERLDEFVRRNYVPFLDKQCCWKWSW